MKRRWKSARGQGADGAVQAQEEKLQSQYAVAINKVLTAPPASNVQEDAGRSVRSIAEVGGRQTLGRTGRERPRRQASEECVETPRPRQPLPLATTTRMTTTQSQSPATPAPAKAKASGHDSQAEEPSRAPRCAAQGRQLSTPGECVPHRLSRSRAAGKNPGHRRLTGRVLISRFLFTLVAMGH